MKQIDELEKTGEYLLCLISCALRTTRVNDEVLSGIDLEKLYILASEHSVAAMTCVVLENSAAFQQAQPEVKKQWLDAKNKAVRKNMLLDADRKILMDEMENAGIWHMPLKGSVLKDWYPQYGMREMSDIDILFDEAKREQVKEIFLRHNYCVNSFNESNHDIYFKPPVYNFEMHASLFEESDFKDIATKYRAIEKKLIPDENKKYCLHFTPEDFYVFALMHAYKHYSHNGTGIRTLADIYIMNRKIGPSMDWGYVEKQLKILGIEAFEKDSRGLAEKIFCDIPVSQIQLTAKERIMLRYYMGAGTYGSYESSLNRHLRSMQEETQPITAFTKFRYCMARLFPGRKWCKDNYPFVYRNPYLLPLFWIWRCFKRIPVNLKRLHREISAVRTSK